MAGSVETQITGAVADKKVGRAHVRIEKKVPANLGDPIMVTDDRIIAVSETGDEVDISSSVRAWTEVSKAGEPRVLILELYCYDERRRMQFS